MKTIIIYAVLSFFSGHVLADIVMATDYFSKEELASQPNAGKFGETSLESCAPESFRKTCKALFGKIRAGQCLSGIDGLKLDLNERKIDLKIEVSKQKSMYSFNQIESVPKNPEVEDCFKKLFPLKFSASDAGSIELEVNFLKKR